LFDLFTSILDVVLHNARIEGQLDSGIVDIKAKKIEMKESPKVMSWCDDVCFGSSIFINHQCMFSMQTVHTDSLSGALTVLFTFTIDRGRTWEVSRQCRSHYCFSLRTRSSL
jgi:hypothetical protein